MSTTQSPSSPNHIFILGGTGRIGQQVITQSLSRGHHVTALIRKPNTLPITHPNLTTITGSPQSTPDITKALTSIPTGQKITIISTLGQTRQNPSNPWSKPTSPALMMTNSIQALIDALRSLPPSSLATVARLVVLSMFGTGASLPYMHWSLRWVMAHSNMRQTLQDHDGVVELVQENFISSSSSSEADKIQIPYVLVRPVMIKFGALDGNDGEGGSGSDGIPEIKFYGEDGREGMGPTLGCDVRAVVGFLVDRVGSGEDEGEGEGEGEGSESGRFDGKMPVIST